VQILRISLKKQLLLICWLEIVQCLKNDFSKLTEEPCKQNQLVPVILVRPTTIICLQQSTNYLLSTGPQLTTKISVGPLEFVAYTEDSSDVVAKHDINQHAYADDNLLHTSCFPRDVARAHQHLSECTADLVVWCAQRRLQLNANKTEVLPVGSKHNLTKRSNEDLSFTIGLETVQPSDAVCDLGVWLDSEISEAECY